MAPERVKQLLEAVAGGRLGVEAAIGELRTLPFADLGYARVDHHRELRQGMPEVILGEGKTAPQIAGIARQLVESGQNVLVTRLDAAKAVAVIADVPELAYAPVARIASWTRGTIPPLSERPVPVMCAGTSDLPVAEEAIECLRMFGVTSTRMADVGIAGMHRMVDHLPALQAAPAVIVVAGMEGALASVVGGLVPAPVVAVPTSVGYGVSLGGLTALFGMLAGCAAGVTVVNIDNGFGAAAAVARMLTVAARAKGAQ